MPILSLVAALALATPAANPQLLTRGDPAALGQQLDGNVVLSIRSLSSDGNVIVYASDATNVLPGDTNGVRDTYAFDRTTNVARRVSLATDGSQFTYETFQPAVSGDGQWALYSTYALIFPPGGFGLEEVGEAYLRNIATGEQRRLGEVAVSGTTYRRARRPFASHDASIVVFHTNSMLDPADTDNREDVYLYRRATDGYQWLSKPRVAGATPAGAQNAGIDDAGAIVVFDSTTDGLVVGDADGSQDVFVYEPAIDRMRRLRDLLVAPPDGAMYHPSVSRNGRWVVFSTTQSTWRADLSNGGVALVVGESTGSNWRGRAVTDDRRVLFETFFSLVPGDSNSTSDVYLWEDGVPDYRRMSANDATPGLPEGASGAPSVTGDGTQLLMRSGTRFEAADTNLYEDAYLRSLAAGSPITRPVLRAGAPLPPRTNGDSNIGRQAISADGRYVVFHSLASDLVRDDTNDARDVFLHDRQLGTTRRISLAGGAQIAKGARCGAISADGRFAAFVAPGLPFGDIRNQPTALRMALDSGVVTIAGPTLQESWIDSSSETCTVLSGDGRYLVFGSNPPDFPGANGVAQLYALDFTNGNVERLSSRPGGMAGTAPSIEPFVSYDGNDVAFQTAAQLLPKDVDQDVDVYLWTRGAGLRMAPVGLQGFTYPSSGSVARTPGGTLLVAFAAETFAGNGTCSSGNSRSAYVWNPVTGGIACASDGLPFIANNNGVTSVAFSAQGARLGLAANSCNFGGSVCAQTFVRDMATGSYATVSQRADGLFSGLSQVVSVAEGGMAVLSSSGALHPDDNSPAIDLYASDSREVLFSDGYE